MSFVNFVKNGNKYSYGEDDDFDIENHLIKKETSDPGFFSGITSGMANMAGGVVDMVDATTGIGRDTADYLNNVAHENSRTKEYEASDMIPFADDYWVNPQGARYGIGQAIGSSIPTLVTAAAIAGGGWAGLGAVGAKTVAKALTKNWVRKGAAIGGIGKALESSAEGGMSYRDLTTADENGKFKYTDQEARDLALEVTGKNLPVLVAGGVVEGALLGGAKVPFLSPKINATDGVFTRIAKKAAPVMGVNAVQEGTTEILQEGISGQIKGEKGFDIYTPSTYNNPLSRVQKMAGAEGALGGAVLAGLPATYRGIRYKDESNTDSNEQEELSDNNETTPPAEEIKPMDVADDVEDWNGVEDNTKGAAHQFGQILRNQYGIEPIITSGRRSEENNRAVNGSSTSWHLKGRAVDLAVGDISDEQAAAIKEAAEKAGWGEVLYHDSGTGKHLHLADYQGEINPNTTVAGSTRQNEAEAVDINNINFDNLFNDPSNRFDPSLQQELIDFAQTKTNESQDIEQLNNLEQMIDNKDYQSIAQMFPTEAAQILNIVPEQQPSSSVTNAVDNAQEQNIKDTHEDPKIIDRAIEYYGRTTNPLEKMLLERLVNNNNIKGIEVAFPFLASNKQRGIGAFNAPQTTPIMEPGKRENVASLANILNSVATQKFDNAEAGLGNVPQKTQSMQPTDPQTQQRLNALTGQVAPQIINPFANDPTPAIQAVQAMKPQPPIPKRSGVLKGAEEKVDENTFRSAVNRGDYRKAAEIARSMGKEDVAKVLDNYTNPSFKTRSEDEIDYMRNARVYGKLLAETAKDNNLDLNYQAIERDIEAGKSLPIKSLEGKLTQQGIDINPIKRLLGRLPQRKNIRTANETQEYPQVPTNEMTTLATESTPNTLIDNQASLPNPEAAIEVHEQPNTEPVNEAILGDNKNNNKTFGDLEEAENELLSALGVERANTKPKKIPKSTPKNNESKNSSNVFGDVTAAEDELLSALGVERAEKKPEKKAFNIVDDSDEALESYIQEFKKAQNGKLSANAFLDPMLMIPAFKIGAVYMHRGANQFVQWSVQMKDSLGDAIEPWLQSIWRSIESYPKNLPFNEKQMSAAFKYAGAKYESGIRDSDQIFSEFEKLIGKEKAVAFKPLIKSSFAGIDEYFNPSADMVKSIENEHKDGGLDEFNDSTDPVAKRNSPRDDKNAVGTDDGGRESVRRGGESLRPIEKERSGEQRNVGLYDSSTNSSGKTSDSTVRTEESTDKERSTRDTKLPRSIVDSYEGMEIERSGTNGVVGTTQDGRNDGSNPVNNKDQKKNKSAKFKAGDLDSIRNDLPMLLPEQQEDVVKAEKRFIESGEQGMLFTNGTGTGKTFTGLGIIKRMVSQGRDNILIVSPQQGINNQWVEAAEKHFGINIVSLENTSDMGKGVTITTYANFQNNDVLAKRNWDLIVSDEAHNLMNNEKGDTTSALTKLRVLTHHVKGFRERFKSIFETKEIRELKKKLADAKKRKNKEVIKSTENDIENEYQANESQRKNMTAEWEVIAKNEKTKVVFLSATPFAYDKDVDYAEGYLFDYPKSDSGAYNSPSARDKFMIDNFGYRMRYGKLTAPESTVDNRVMEVQFHEKLKASGALSGRKLSVDKDYDRGFLLVDGGIGKKIDEGFEVLRGKKNGFGDLRDVLVKQFGNRDKNYLLESIKARESIKFIQEYLDSGKKIVIFHDRKKERQVYHPFKLDENTKFENTDQKNNAMAQYKRFKAEYPEFANLNLSDLKSPIETLTKTFGDDILLLNGDVSKKQCSKNVSDFNSDDSGKNIILVQSDKGNAGISLHDVTGEHQRVLINLGIPRRPTYAIQIEGRIYRTGNASNAIFRYLSTGTELEKGLFANTVAQRASTAENLALGEDARNLRDSFVSAFMETLDGTWVNRLPNAENEGIGGIETDKAADGAISEFDRAKTFYYAQQKKSAKNKAQEGKDYFATPEPLGLKMVEWANLSEGESVLEPSAGHGAIARFFSPNHKSVAIEPSRTLSPILKMNVDGTNVIDSSFEDYYVGNKFDAVVMNPPFGKGGKTAIEHVSKAFDHLRDQGRIVAIIPNGPSCQKHLEKWLYGDENADNKTERQGARDAVLVREILLPNVTFKNAGTQVGCKVLVIDKQTTQKGKDETITSGAVELHDVKNIEELFDRIKDLDMPTRYKGDTSRNEESAMDDTSSSQKESKFDTSDFVHTKTKANIPAAKLKGFTHDFKSVNSLAKKYNGIYSGFAKRYLFKDNESRDSFVKEADALLYSSKLSARDPVSILSDLTFVTDKQLTKDEAAVKNFGEEMGTPIVFFSAPAGLHGFHSEGITFLNRLSEIPIEWVFWHESFHWMKNNNPALYKDMVDYFQKHSPFTQAQIDFYKKQINRDISNKEAIEEMLADQMPNIARKFGLMNMGKTNTSLLERFGAWILDMMRRFKEIHKAPLGLNKAQERIINPFIKMLRDAKNADGKYVFNIKSRSDIKIASNGMPIELFSLKNNVAYSIKNDLDNETDLSDNLSKEERKKLDGFANNVIQKIEKEGNKILERFDPRNGLESLREQFVSKESFQERNDAFALYQKNPNSNYATIRLGKAARQLNLERKEIVENDDIWRSVTELLTGAKARGSYTEIIKRMQGYRRGVDETGRGGSVRVHTSRTKEIGQVSWLSLKVPAEREPQARDGSLNLYQEGLAKYDQLMKDKKTAQAEYDKSVGQNPINDDKVKLSFNNRHERDRERMRAAEKTAQEYVPEGYKGTASGVMEGLAEHEMQSIKKHIQSKLAEGQSVEYIEKDLRALYNRIKANKSDGRTEKQKADAMMFLKGAIAYARESLQGGRISERLGSDTRTQEQGGYEPGVPKHGRSGNDGRGLRGTDSKIDQDKHAEKGAFSTPEIKYSINNSHGTFMRAVNNVLIKTGFKELPNIETHIATPKNGMNPFRMVFNSFNKIAEKYPNLKPFFRAANIAREKQENMRTHFQHKIDKIETMLGRQAFGKSNLPTYKQNKEDLNELLWQGDALGREFNLAEIKEMGLSLEVAKAYRMMRTAIQESWKLVNDIKQQITTHSKTITTKELAALKENKFVSILGSQEDAKGNHFTVWKQPKVFERKEVLSKTEYQALKADENVQIISVKEEKASIHIMPESSGLLRGDEFWEVEYRSQSSPLGKRDGYIPHFFHNFFVMQKVVDDKGKAHHNMLKSAKSMREAVLIGNEYMRKHPDAKVVISQKQFQFANEAMQAAVIGDKDYFKITKRLSDDLAINVQDAQKLLQDKISRKNRRRYFGNAVHRKGVEGFEEDMNWVMRNYFNQVSRYVAMDEFKRTTINRYEQLFGKFDDDPKSLQAGFVKDFISDVNGNPTKAEKMLDNIITHIPIVDKILGSAFPGRPSLQAAGWLTSVSAAAKLNFLNVASTMIQFTQLINIAGVLNSWDYVFHGIKAAKDLTLGRKRILYEAGRGRVKYEYQWLLKSGVSP